MISLLAKIRQKHYICYVVTWNFQLLNFITTFLQIWWCFYPLFIFPSHVLPLLWWLALLWCSEEHLLLFVLKMSKRKPHKTRDTYLQFCQPWLPINIYVGIHCVYYVNVWVCQPNKGLEELEQTELIAASCHSARAWLEDGPFKFSS